jgi:hypothetical protein
MRGIIGVAKEVRLGRRSLKLFRVAPMFSYPIFSG